MSTNTVKVLDTFKLPSLTREALGDFYESLPKKIELAELNRDHNITSSQMELLTDCIDSMSTLINLDKLNEVVYIFYRDNLKELYTQATNKRDSIIGKLYKLTQSSSVPESSSCSSSSSDCSSSGAKHLSEQK